MLWQSKGALHPYMTDLGDFGLDDLVDQILTELELGIDALVAELVSSPEMYDEVRESVYVMYNDGHIEIQVEPGSLGAAILNGSPGWDLGQKILSGPGVKTSPKGVKYKDIPMDMKPKTPLQKVQMRRQFRMKGAEQMSILSGDPAQKGTDLAQSAIQNTLERVQRGSIKRGNPQYRDAGPRIRRLSENTLMNKPQSWQHPGFEDTGAVGMLEDTFNDLLQEVLRKLGLD